jgi:NADH dehydrogenase
MQEKTDKQRPRVAVVGAGFAGLWAARALGRQPVDVMVVDRNNYHTFLPLLYQVAAAEVAPEEIVYPVRSVVRGLSRVRFIMAEVTGVDVAARTVSTGDASIPYDYLVLAAGSVSNFFGVPGAEEHAFRLKTMDDGIALRNHILSRFEAAQNEPDPGKRQQAMTFTIAGGGPTGVEFAGALAELIRGPLAKDYRNIDLREARVVLLEARDALLEALPTELRAYSAARLRAMGVDVRLGSVVSRVTPASVELLDGTIFPTETVVWTSGVRVDDALRSWGLPVDAEGRIPVRPTLQLEGHPEVYVVGDLAHAVAEGQPVPMVAPAATQQGEVAARNIVRHLRGGEPEPFRYRDPGTMVTIGRNAAVAYLRGRSFTGFPAWILWLFVHIISLIGFRNRLFVLTDWALDYFFYERAVRLILASCRKCAP